MAGKVQQLQLLQKNMENILQQKQQLETQHIELDAALQEVASAEKSYKQVGKILIAVPGDLLRKELQEKKDIVDIRLKNILKQEENLKQKIEEVQKEAVKELQGK
ncbi:prefoldin subunit [Candidatus Woesearchaeota archaeon]|nr:prefoldin subunit [Candidatus Woesearchaeota archaeon]